MEEIQEQLVELKMDWSSSELYIKEKVKKLRIFVKSVKDNHTLEEDEVDELLLTISTADFTSKRLLIELANEFRRPHHIVEALKLEDRFLARRALSFSWIFEEGNSVLTETSELKQILPVVSYTTRLRIIQQIGMNLKNEEISEEIFSDLEETYGTGCAVEMLNACSTDFIQKRLIYDFNNRRLMPSDKVLRQVAMKDCQIALDYIKEVFSEIRDKFCDHEKLTHKRKNGCNLTLKYLWLTLPREVWKMYEIFDTKILPKLTWQEAKKLFKTDRKLIVDAKKFAQLIPEKRRRHVAKYMGSMFQPFFTALFPDEMDHFPDQIQFLFQWLQCISRVKRVAILNTGFRENYRCDLLAVPEFISPEIMEILPLGHREQVAKMKLEAADVTHFGDLDFEESKVYMEAYWFSFTGIKKSVPKLKTILLEEIEMKIRTDVAELLVYTCYINDRDVDSLTTICKLIASKFAHGHAHIREKFLKAIEKRFGYRKLKKDSIWEVLEDFVKLAKSNFEPVPKSLLESIIEYHLQTHQPIDMLVDVMLSRGFTHKYGAPDWDFLKHDPVLHKEFLRIAAELICKNLLWEEHRCAGGSEHDIHWHRLGMLKLCEAFTNWNKRNKKLAKLERLSIVEFPWVVCRLREMLMVNPDESNVGAFSTHAQLQQKILDVIKTDPEIKTGYFKQYLDACPLAVVLEYFLRTDPAEIADHLGSIVPYMLKLDEKLFKAYRPLLIKIKTQGFPHLEAAIVEVCLETAQDDAVSWTEKKHATLMLSYLWDAKSYLNTLSLFYPGDDETVLGDSSMMDYRIRLAVVQSLSHVSTASQYINDAFAAILKFCIHEDYLNASIGPLTSLCLNASSREAIKFLKEDLLDRDISLKHHTIKLICQISDKTDEFQETLSYLFENEVHHSIREFVLVQMFHLLAESPTPENWGLLKGALETLTAEDNVLLQHFYKLSNVVHVPLDFLPDYFLTCLEKFPDSATSKPGNVAELEFFAGSLEIASQFIDYLPLDFVEHLLEQHLFEIKEAEIVQQAAVDLAVAYCLKLNRNLPRSGHIFRETLTKLNSTESWNYNKQSKRMVDLWIRASNTNFPSRQALYTFVVTLCYESFKKLSLHGTPLLKAQDVKDMYKFIAEVIQSLFKKQDTFTVWFYLQCARIFCPVQFHFAFNQGKVRTKENREDGFRLLTEAGKRFQKLVDEQIKNYGPFLLGFIIEKIVTFFKDVCKQEESLLENEKVVFFVDGLLKPPGTGENGMKTGISQAVQILALHLMLPSPPRSMHFRRKYGECQDELTKQCGRTTKIFLSDRYYKNVLEIEPTSLENAGSSSYSSSVSPVNGDAPERGERSSKANWLKPLKAATAAAAVFRKAEI